MSLKLNLLPLGMLIPLILAKAIRMFSVRSSVEALGNRRGGAVAQLHGLLQIGHSHVGRDGFGLKQHLAAFQVLHHLQDALAHGGSVQPLAIDLLLEGKGIGAVIGIKADNIGVAGRTIGSGFQRLQDLVDGGGIRAR